MTRLRVDFFSISLDGYGAGPQQSFDNPLGVGGESLHDWFVVTHSFRQDGGQAGGETGVDDDFAARGAENLGAFIMGRNMIGPPQGGDWVDDTWKGWWGDNPPYHGPVFVLTHYPRASTRSSSVTRSPNMCRRQRPPILCLRNRNKHEEMNLEHLKQWLGGITNDAVTQVRCVTNAAGAADLERSPHQRRRC